MRDSGDAGPAKGDARVTLLETLGFDGATWRFADRHAARMAASAEAFGMPFDAAAFRSLLDHARPVPGQRRLLRLALSPDGDLTSAVRLAGTVDVPVRLVVTGVCVASDDPMLRHKTTQRTLYDAAADAARQRGADDGILVNEAGRITETSRLSLFVRKGHGPLRTPPLADGLLPGVLRAHLLDAGLAVEASLTPGDLVGARVFVGNAARGLLPAVVVAG